MTREKIMQLLEETGAVLHGHFLLTSGLHSPMYVEKFQLLQYPEYTELLCKALAESFRKDDVPMRLITAVREKRMSAAVSAGPTRTATMARGGAVKISRKLLTMPPMSDAQSANSNALARSPRSPMG